MSHLPDPVLSRLRSIVAVIDDGLQGRNYTVSKAMEVDRAFDRGFVDNGLTRALLLDIVKQAADVRLGVKDLGNGGCELTDRDEDGVERRFRLRRGKRDAEGRLAITVGSESFLTKKVKHPTLFEDWTNSDGGSIEQWVLAYFIDPTTRTLKEVYVAEPIDVIGKSPFRLVFGSIIPVPIEALVASSFVGDEEDLVLDDERVAQKHA